MNLLPKQTESQSSGAAKEEHSQATSSILSSLDLSFLTGEVSKKAISAENQNGDDSMVDITSDHPDTNICISSGLGTELTKHDSVSNADSKAEVICEKIESTNRTKVDIKPLNELSVKLESIKPSSIPPLTVLEEKNGVSVTLHFAKDRPRDDVQVFVVTTISKNASPFTNYLFQGVVPKVSFNISTPCFILNLQGPLPLSQIPFKLLIIFKKPGIESCL